MIRIGLLGAARIAPKAMVIPVGKRDDCTITAVGARDPEKAAAFITENQLSARTMDYATLCQDPDIDMVYCALPPSAHVIWVCMALEAGKSVLCEKPFAMNVDEARQMQSAAADSKGVLMEAFHYYFHPAFQKVRSVVKSGRLGTVRSFNGVFNVPIKNKPGELRYVRELGGGGLMDLGCYPLHAFRSLIGEPDVITASAELESGVDVSLIALLKCGGVEGRIECNMRGPRAIYFELEGEKGSLRFEGFVAPQEGYQITVSRLGDGSSIEVPVAMTYDRQLDHFVDLLAGGDPLLPLTDAVAQQSAIDAIYGQVFEGAS